MANELINNLTIARKLDKHLTIKQTNQSALYSAILAGTQTLPPNMVITLVATSGNARTTKITGDTEAAWSVAEGITVSTTSVSDALKAKTAINALAVVSTANASDPATTQALANANKVAINAIIASLKA